MMLGTIFQWLTERINYDTLTRLVLTIFFKCGIAASFQYWGFEMVLKTAEDKRMAAKLQLQVDLFLKKKAGKVRHIRPTEAGLELVVVRKSFTKN